MSKLFSAWSSFLTSSAMAKKSGNVERKKARIEKPVKLKTSRVNGSPTAVRQKSAQPEVEEISSIPMSPKRQGKQKETATPTAEKNPNKVKKDVEVHKLTSSFKVIAGSYEKLLYGLNGTTSFDNGKLEFHLKPIFIFAAHVSCIKAVAASPNGGKWLATGSADEIVKVWDLRRRKEIGGLMHHEGSITHLIFPSRSHLLSASEDGTLCLFRARDWAVLRALKGHKGRINSVAVHPSGKVALSVGKDKTLRMWDLMRGKGVASTKLGKEGEIVRWSGEGSLFAVQAGSTIDIYNTEMALLHAIRHPSRVHDVKFVKRMNVEGDVLLVGAEDKKTSVYDVQRNPESIPTIIASMVGHTNRVKAIQSLEISLPDSCGRTSTTIISTVSSDGNIHIYDIFDLPANVLTDNTNEISPVATYDSNGTRLTCVTLADGDESLTASATGKRKREDDQADSEEHEESELEDQFEDEKEGEMETEEEEEAQMESD